MENEKISFIGYHIPGLQSGNLTISSDVTFKANNINQPPFESNELDLLVAGPRFIFSPKEIYSVFPPRDSLGEHENVLPHIELEPSTLPWSRSTGGDEKTPWLALLLLQEGEWRNGENQNQNQNENENENENEDQEKSKVVVQRKTWEEYRKAVEGLKSEVTDQPPEGEKPFPPLKILNLNRKFLNDIFPSIEELEWLSHVRIGHDVYGNEVERAVLVCNRMPKAGARAAVHLVSLEERIKDEKFDFSLEESGDGKDDRVTLLSIHSWEFTCPDNEQFELNEKTRRRLPESLLNEVNNEIKKNPKGALQNDFLYRGKPNFIKALDVFNDTKKAKLVNTCHIQTETFKGLMDSLDLKWIHIPKPLKEKGDAKQFFEIGSLPLAHGLRHGGKTISWYRGPLIADRNLSEDTEQKLLAKLPIRTADHLLIYNKNTGMLDTSYAAAWELGRLISVSQPRISQQISQWKTSHAREVALAEQNLVFSHIPFNDSDFVHQEGSLLCTNLQQYFTDLSLLKSIPFQYLVPHESYLPDESMRFFYIDPLWMECCLDGAFSIGRTTEYDENRERSDHENLSFPHKSIRPRMTGVLLRSDLISGWPSLMVEAYKGKTATSETAEIKDLTKLENLRFERLGSNVLIVIFDGEVDVVTVHLPPESLHCGFSRPTNGHVNYFKEIKDIDDGHEIENGAVTVDIKFKGDGRLRVLDVLKFKNNTNDKLKEKEKKECSHSGQLAIELMEGVPRLEVKLKRIDN